MADAKNPKLPRNQLKMTSTEDYKFEGWLGHDEKSVHGNMVWGDFEPKPWEENDVDIEITHSGVCGTDIHSLRNGWVSLLVIYGDCCNTDRADSRKTWITPSASAMRSSARSSVLDPRWREDSKLETVLALEHSLMHVSPALVHAKTALLAKNSIAPSSSQHTLHNTSTRSEEHTSELQSQSNLVCRLLLEKKNKR